MISTSTPLAAASGSLALAIVGWALAPVMIRYLSTEYDPFTHIFFRYIATSSTLVVVCAIWFRAEVRAMLRKPRVILALVSLNMTQQVLWTYGCYGASATMAQLITKLSVILVIIFSFIFFHEERRVIANPLFGLGALCSFVGLVALLLDDPASFSFTWTWATLFLLLTATCWAVYTVWAKHLVTDAHPVALFAVMAVTSTMCFAGLAAVLGDIGRIRHVPLDHVAIFFFSGTLPLALAHPCYFYAQKHLGAALSGAVQLAVPLITFVVAIAIWPDEWLKPTQWVGAALLLGGTAIVILVGQRKRPVASTQD